MALGFLFIHGSSAAASAPRWIFIDRLILSCGYLCTSLVPVFFMRFLRPLSISKSYPALALAVVGVFFSSFAHLALEASAVLSIIGALFIGVEYAWLTLMWIDLLGNIGIKRTTYYLGWALFCSSVIYFSISPLPKLAGTVLTSLLPVFSTILLALCHKRIASVYSTTEEENRAH